MRCERKRLPAAELKRALAAVSVVLLVTAATALPVNAQADGESRLRRLRIGITGWENNLTPFSMTFASQPTTVDLLNLIYDTLFWSQAREEPEPWLAEEAEPSPDRKLWTVKLRSDVKWHDGRPFTAEDVKFSFEYFKRHAGQTGRYGHHIAEVPTFERGQVVSSTELRLLFTEPVPAFRTLPGGDLPILPKHIWQGTDQPLQATQDKPVGTGPFAMVEMKDRDRYKLKANSAYFKGRPLIEEIELIVAGDPNVSFNDLVAGKLDLVSSTVPPIFVDQLAANPDIKVVTASRMESVQLNFNALKQPLSDPKLRKAISLGIDNRVLVKTVTGGRGLPGVDTFIHPESAWAAPNPQHEFDVGKANQILDSAGYSRKDSDGVRKGPDGKRLVFSALFSTLEPESLQTLQLISQMTTAIGVSMEPEPATPAELRAVRRSPPGSIPAYDAYVSQLEAHTHSDPDGLFFFFHSPGKGMGGQITGYSNPNFDRIVEDAAITVNVAERKRKLNEAQALLAEEVPSLPLFYPKGVYAFRPTAYDGWLPDPGHGILTKRSFLEDYARAAGEGAGGASVPPAWIFLGGVVALVVVGSGLVLLRRRPAAVPEVFEADEEFESSDEPSVMPVPAGVPGVEEPWVEAEPAAPQTDRDADPVGAPSRAAVLAGLGSSEAHEQKDLSRTSAAQTSSLPEPPRWPSFIGPEPPEPPQGPPPLPPLPGPFDLEPEKARVERSPSDGIYPPGLQPPEFHAGEKGELPPPQRPPIPQFSSFDRPAETPSGESTSAHQEPPAPLSDFFGESGSTPEPPLLPDSFAGISRDPEASPPDSFREASPDSHSPPSLPEASAEIGPDQDAPATQKTFEEKDSDHGAQPHVPNPPGRQRD